MVTPSSEKQMPPYGPTSWYETFFDLNQRQKIEKVDLDFIRLNIASSKDEYKVFSGLRFLGLIKEDGTATDKLANLRVVGDDFRKNLTGIIKEAYQDLFSKIVLEKARPDNLINYFLQKYEIAASTAEKAAKLFVYFAKKTEIPISSELQSIESEKRTQVVKKPTRITKQEARITRPEAVPEGIEELRYGEIRIWLPKGDVDSVRKAIRLLEFHNKELEGCTD